jgi:N-acyl-D-aspartate/D-glutamate deacylase
MATYDVVSCGGTVVDGMGIPKYGADLSMKDRVAAIERVLLYRRF